MNTASMLRGGMSEIEKESNLSSHLSLLLYNNADFAPKETKRTGRTPYKQHFKFVYNG